MVAENELADQNDARSRRRRWVRPMLASWGALVCCFLLWQTLTYRGLMALAAEWQFNAFGRYYPSLTYVLLAVLIASPVLWLLRMRAPAAAGMTVPGRNFIRALLGIAACCGAACLIVLVTMWSLPRDGDTPQRLAVGSAAATVPATGATILIGDVLRSQAAGLSQSMTVGHRDVRFAPIVAPGAVTGAGAAPIAFFVEIGDARTQPDTGEHRGILRRGGLPGEIERLYHYAGLQVSQPYYVLFASSDSLQWPYSVAATQLLFAGIVCALVALAMHARRERLRRRLAAETTTSPT